MKKDKTFAKMASVPEEGLASFQPSIISDVQPEKVNEEGREEISQSKPNFNGELCVRIPQSLCVKLYNEAKEEGVTLEEYVLYKLASRH